MTENNSKKNEKSFEEAVSELEVIVRKLESGDLQLEEAIKEYEQGNKILKLCEERLSKAKLKVDKIMKSKSGDGENNYSTEEFDVA